MQTVQRLLLLLFAAFAALTVLQQIRYGMICGRSEQEDKQDDPKAKACRQQSTGNGRPQGGCVTVRERQRTCTYICRKQR